MVVGREPMAAEFLQFAAILGTFVVVALLWLRVVFIPGRTMERWKDQRKDLRRGENDGGTG